MFRYRVDVYTGLRSSSKTLRFPFKKVVIESDTHLTDDEVRKRFYEFGEYPKTHYLEISLDTVAEINDTKQKDDVNVKKEKTLYMNVYQAIERIEHLTNDVIAIDQAFQDANRRMDLKSKEILLDLLKDKEAERDILCDKLSKTEIKLDDDTDTSTVVGKYAYKNYGLLYHQVGVIIDTGTRYAIEFKSGLNVSFDSLNDITILSEEEEREILERG